MKQVKIIFLFVLLDIILLTPYAMATHNRAGEITFRQIGDFGDNKFEITVTTYTEISSPANRSEITIYFGDGDDEVIPLVERHDIGNSTYYNRYTTTHTYPGPGIYTLEFFDPNRVADVRNMQNSVYTPFYIHTELQISPSKGFNRSPVLLQQPIDFAEKGYPFEHNPNAYDPDGDSLVFSLIPPKQNVDENVYGYYKPGAANGFTLDPYTGHLTWDYPDTVGIYNIAILVEEFRNGQRIGYIVRDMQIIVLPGNNHPPIIDPIADTCAEAGHAVLLKVPVHASDLDVNQLIVLSAGGGPFLQKTQSARLMPSQRVIGKEDVFATFEWTPGCNTIRKEPYGVVFKAYDSIIRNYTHTPLTDLEHFFIHVVGPAPENLTATATVKGIDLNWAPPSACSNARGYYIYRKIDSSFWDTTVCETGVPAYSRFQLIDSTFGYSRTHYLDDNKGAGLIPGVVYCYRVTAYYVGENFKMIEGYASREVCARQQKDKPVITHVSVLKTDPVDGIIFTDWSKPVELDTLLYKGPYTYKLFRSKGNKVVGASKTQVAEFTAAGFYQLSDTVFIESGLNTTGQQYSYQIEFYSTDNGQPFYIGNTQSASSVFLGITPSHKSLELNWTENVPWYNDYYIIYRKRSKTNIFDSIGWSKKPLFTDTGLVNGQEYCYKIESFGYFSSSNFVYPILNFSQEVCATPVDTIPPCPPVISARSLCDLDESQLNWWYMDSSCADDIIGFNIYYSELLNEDYKLVRKLQGKYIRDYTDQRSDLEYSLAGCYLVTAVDSYGNESVFSNRACVDNCPNYELPNVFTPNNDGVNDLVIPIDGYQHIEKVDMYIFNRWGQLVFQTNDPMINWDGKENEKGKDCSPGTYYYICHVYQIYLNGLKAITLKGTITLLR